MAPRHSKVWRIALGCLGVVGLGTVVVGGACFVLLQRSTERRASERAALDGDASVRVTADQLLSEYNANEIGADGRYKDRLIEVSGQVALIKKDPFGSPYLTLSTGRQLEFRQVHCGLVDEDSARALSPGFFVVVRGKGAGLNVNVILRPCKVVESVATAFASPATDAPPAPTPRLFAPLSPTTSRPLLPTRAALSPVPSPSASAEASAVLALLEPARFGDLAFSIDDYQVTQSCPGDRRGEPADRAEFVIVHATVANVGDNAASLPFVSYELGGYRPVSPLKCSYSDGAFNYSCRQQMFPGARCDGWILFEVPQAFPLSNHPLKVTAGRTVVQWSLARERSSPRS